MGYPRPQGYGSIEIKDAPASSGTAPENGQGGGNRPLIGLRVSVHKKENFAPCFSCARVAHRRDFATPNSQRACTCVLCNLPRRISRSVIHHDQLIGFPEWLHAFANAAQALADPQRFIMCRDDEGDHNGLTQRMSYHRRKSKGAILTDYLPTYRETSANRVAGGG